MAEKSVNFIWNTKYRGSYCQVVKIDLRPENFIANIQIGCALKVRGTVITVTHVWSQH